MLAWLLLRGRTGRAFRAVRDSETAAVSSGVDLARYKTLAFAVSAAYAGVAGSLFAIATTFVNPDTFPIALSIFLLVGVVVAGLGSLLGPVAGAIFIYFMQASWAQDMDKLIPDWLPFLGELEHELPRRPGRRLRRRPDPRDVPAAHGRGGAHAACRRADPPQLII